ncbi:hypothetical protein [Streptomyces sp. NBC_00239]|uniref:hypothetical protein n=1 Tax=Streptomyces sp. NBC_00239 TaxID=2903640 RepID=UPI002E2B40CE|nr:hypothetical protein [Streptomyces sp. NBC_00239]
MYSILIRLRRPLCTGGRARSADVLRRRLMTAPVPGVEHVSLEPVSDGADGIVFVCAPDIPEAVRTARILCESVLAAEGFSDWRLTTCQADVLNVSGLWLPAHAG